MFNIYLISSEINGNKLHKIGYTRRKVETRVKEFKTGNASEFKIVDTFYSKWGTKIESQLHNIFKLKKLSGEWFELDDDDIKSFKQHCQKIHENLEIIATQNSYYQQKGDF